MQGVWQEINEDRLCCHSWRDLAEHRLSAMDTVIAAVLFVAVVAALVIALELTHRRTWSLRRAPFGADAPGDRDIARMRAEIDARAAERSS